MTRYADFLFAVGMMTLGAGLYGLFVLLAYAPDKTEKPVDLSIDLHKTEENCQCTCKEQTYAP